MKGIVTVPLLNVRANPDGNVIGRIKQDELITIFEKKGEWYEVEYRGVPRYVMVRFVAECDENIKMKKGTVTAGSLNIRKQPDGEIIGKIKKGDIVYIFKEEGDWLRIFFEGNPGYVMKKYVNIIKEEANFIGPPPLELDNIKKTGLKGKVIASSLNIRNRPDGDVIGKILKDDIVDVTDVQGEWLKIEFNKGDGYISSKYVELNTGVITASSLNVRNRPDGDVLGKLKRGTNLIILENKDGWVKINYEGQIGYLAAEYVQTGTNIPAPRMVFFHQRDDLRKLALEPQKKLEVAGTKEQKTCALIWNQFGNLIQTLSAELKIDVASAVAVLCVESGGNGFAPDGKMLIRFENHLFYNFWGKQNQEKFDKHFRFNIQKRWLEHYFRTDENGEWVELHNKNAQKNEWDALNFARTLDDSDALFSISMGAPQVMGFNYQILGYQSVQEMFDKFSSGIYYHICALFDFCMDRPVRIKYLQDRDYTSFARAYNGPGQPEKYGTWIKAYYNAFPLK
jgi:uncharacterized protein YgiM (DUF1202 family)